MSHSETEVQAGPVQVRGEVLTVRRVGAYHRLTVVAPGIADATRPGQFVALAVGGDDTVDAAAPRVLDLRRRGRGVYGGTVEFVFAVHGAGTALAGRAPGQRRAGRRRRPARPPVRRCRASR